MIMSETKDKFEPKHTFVVYYKYTRSRARAIFIYIPIVLKHHVYVQWILPTVTYACVTCNPKTQQTFKLRTLQRVRARIIPNITWRHHQTAQYIQIHPSQKKKSTRFHGNDNQTQMLLGCITFGTHPGTYTKLERSRTYFKDCF